MADQRTGRSDAGNLRNFRAMSDGKASDLLFDLLFEANDREALDGFADQRSDKLDTNMRMALRSLARRV